MSSYLLNLITHNLLSLTKQLLAILISCLGHIEFNTNITYKLMPSKHQLLCLEQHLVSDPHVFNRYCTIRDAHHHAVHHICNPYQAIIIIAAVR